MLPIVEVYWQTKKHLSMQKARRVLDEGVIDASVKGYAIMIVEIFDVDVFGVDYFLSYIIILVVV